VHTGRQLALLRGGLGSAAVRLLRNAAGLRVAPSTEFARGFLRTPLAPGEGVLFQRLGAALLYADPEQSRALTARAGAPVLMLQPERYVRAHSLQDITTCSGDPPQLLSDTPYATWGLEATRTLSSRYTGAGVRVAILDTGLDLGHPDFAGRTILAQSFVAERPVEDVNGHGTFCAGVACGPKVPSQGPRYGVACAADLCIAKVLNDDAGGIDGNVLAGIEWAVRNDCAVICLSLGSPVALGDSYPEVYEHVAARALAAGSLLIAPAGNESQRPDTIAPVEHPANCPSVVAIGALDRSLTVASFSNGGLNPDGGEVDLAAPGICISSAAPRPALYQSGSGTSMAAPFAAGIAALLAEADLFARGARLRDLLLTSFRTLPDPPRDVGAGLVQAPQ
jgi:subtilisin family serine protease